MMSMKVVVMKKSFLAKSPNRKWICDDAFDAMTLQARKMKQVTQKKTYKQFDVGSIVQVPLADVDTT